MAAPKKLRTTPLYPRHTDAGANMAPFGEYEMPLWYTAGAKQEHLAVLTAAGLFDTSHMATLHVTGKDALALLSRCFTRDPGTLAAGRCIYGAFLNEKGYAIDDAIIGRLGDEEFMVVVNSGMGGRLVSHLQNNSVGLDVSIRELSPGLGKIDIQGPQAARILAEVLEDPESVFSGMVYFSFRGRPDSDSSVRLKNGTPVLVSRTGYTGEFGFELFLNAGSLTGLWDDLLNAGEPYGILPCGLASRDSLRAGAGLPLSHQDIGNWPFVNHPWEFALPWNEEATGFTKDFIGAEALLEGSGLYTCLFAGKDPRKVGAENAEVLDSGGKRIGRVLTCTTDMGITEYEGRIVSVATPDLPDSLRFRGISCGFVQVDRPLVPGTELVLREGKRTIAVSVTDRVRPDRTARKAMSNFL